MASNDKEYNHNVETGEISVQEMTDQEQLVHNSVIAEKVLAKETKLAAKQAAQAKLAALGLTTEDLQALGL
jgi:hypothetical protein